MTFPGTPDHESHDRFPLSRPLPHEGEERFVSRIRDFHINSRSLLARPHFMKIVLKRDRQTGPQIVAVLEQLLTGRYKGS